MPEIRPEQPRPPMGQPPAAPHIQESETKEELRETAEQLQGDVERMKGEAEQAVGAQKNAFAREVQSVAHALRVTTEQLEKEGHASAAGYASRAARATERLGRSLEQKRLSEVVDDIESMGREQPIVLLAASTLLGFAATRFMRSSDSKGEK